MVHNLPVSLHLYFLKMTQQSLSPQGLKNIFVTGGTGFLGAYIIKELIEKGYQVRAIRRTAKLPFFVDTEILNKVEWVEGDILDVVSLFETMKSCDAVIHAAAQVSFHSGDRANMYKTNVEGTANVVNAAIENNIARFVYVSSVAAIGRSATGEAVDEEKKWQATKTNTAYAVSKYNAEVEAWRGFAEGLNTVIVNPSTILGYGDWNSSSCALFKNAFNEFPWYTTGVNGFVDVEDVAKAIVLLMEKDVNGERYLLNAENISFQQLFTSIANGFKKKPPSKKANWLLGEIAWRWESLKSIFTGKRPLLTKESARVAHSKTLFSNAKVLQALPEFSFTPLEKTIARSCDKYLSNKK